MSFLHSNAFKGLLGFLLVFQNTAKIMLMRLSQESLDGQKTFHPPALVVLNEVSKLTIWTSVVIVSAFLSKSSTTDLSNTQSPQNKQQTSKRRNSSSCLKQLYHIYISRDVLLFIPPAAFFTISIVSNIIALQFISPAHYTLLIQFRLLMTAFLSRIILKQTFTQLQWISLFCLSGGVAIAQMSEMHSTPLTSGQLNEDNDLKSNAFWMGTVITLSSAVCSALAGVLTERLLKQTSLSLAARSIQLCAPAVLAASMLMFGDMLFKENRFYFPFEHFNMWTWLLLLLEMMGGFLTAGILRFGSTVLRAIAAAFNLFLTTVACYWIWPQHPPGALFLLGGTLVTSAALVYHSEGIKQMTSH